jgi:hypothetical protein
MKKPERHIGAKLEADYAFTLRAEEVEGLTPSATIRSPLKYWNGWKYRWWPTSIIEKGVRLYGFDKRAEHRNLCALLEIVRGGCFRYRTETELKVGIKDVTGFLPNQAHPRWRELLSRLSDDGESRIGIAFQYRIVKCVDIPLQVRCEQIGWLKLKRA